MRSCLILALAAAVVGAEIPDVAVEPAWPAFTAKRPVDLDFAPPEIGIAYVLEQKTGKVLAFKVDGDGASAEFLDVSEGLETKGNEEGLLALELAVDYAESGVFYLYYTASDPRRGVVSRLRAAGPAKRVDRASEEILLEVPQPFGNHNGADLQFGPDGMLYVSLGDGGAGGDPKGHGQNTETLLGNVLRLDVGSADPGKAYAVPPDNPFVGRDGFRPEIWCFGLRNPWRMSFDRETGKLWAGDVGQNAWEEVDILVAGGNYGWNPYEGTRPFPKKQLPLPADHVPPVFEYDRNMERGGLSITGGYVYRGQRYPALQGIYLCADYASGNLWGIEAANPTNWKQMPGKIRNPSSFAEDHAGELYVVHHSGTLGRVVVP